MLDAILKYFSRWILDRLTRILDPEAAARAAKLLTRSNELDEAEKALAVREKAFQDRLIESDKKAAGWQAKTVELDNQIAELSKKFAADTEVRKGLEDDLAKREADISNRPDSDRIGESLPGTNSDSGSKVP